MRNQWKGFVSGMLAMALLIGLIGTAFATSYQKQATLDYSGIKITLDGKAITPTDANGKTVEPFAINGTTYLPVRGIASALGLGVTWDQGTQTVQLTTGGQSAQSPVMRYYPGSTIPMLENIITGQYTKEYQSPDGNGGFYQYSASVLPALPNDDSDTYLDDYIALLVSAGFEINEKAAEAGDLFLHNYNNGQGLFISAESPATGFSEECLVITVFTKEPQTSTSKTTITDGTYKVGTDIPAGTYKLTCTSNYGGYWARLSDASGEMGAIIANDNFSTTTYVTVLSGEYLELTRCTGVLQ